MEAMRESWTDDRLDDLTRRMDGGFERVDEDIRELRGEMQVRFDSIDRRFEGIDRRLDSLQRTLIWFCGSLFVAIVGLMTAFMLGQ